jgi:HD-GYP domain-containing protein (c-di-GMP phosphodiesterase class II)
MEMTPGMVLGEDVEYQGQVLFKAETVIDKKMIDRISRYNIMCVTIYDESDFATTHNEKMQFNRRFQIFQERYNDCLIRYKGTMISFLGTLRPIFDNDLIDIYNDIYETIANGSELLDFLYTMMPNEDELTYTQSLNAALLAGTFADWLSLSPEDKRVLILCGFYYDIGKWKLPYEILWKPGKLTDEEFKQVQNHPVTGYSIVRNDLDLNEHVKNAVIMHHERFDGSGYPYHMKGEKIDLFARYMAIVDTYVAMASPRTYREAFTPLQILSSFENSMEKYDVELLVPLMKKIADSQIGTTVQLNDGTIWEVLIIHPTSYGRPVLKNDKNEFLDLSMHHEKNILKNV